MQIDKATRRFRLLTPYHEGRSLSFPKYQHGPYRGWNFLVFWIGAKNENPFVHCGFHVL